MSKTWLKLLFGVALLVMISVPAHADTIITFNNGNGCGGSNCFGNNLTLLIHSTGGNNYTITLTIDTSGNTNTGAGIAGVNFKLDSGGGITSANLTSFNGGGTAGWATSVSTGLNSNSGCSSGNGASFGCSEDTSFWTFSSNSPSYPTPLASLPNNGTYQWVWDATTNAPFNQATDLIHVGVLFGKQDSQTKGCGKHCTTTTYFVSGNGIISASGLGSTPPPPPTPPVPEPGTLVLLGTGLAGLAGIVRRRIG